MVFGAVNPYLSHCKTLRMAKGGIRKEEVILDFYTI